MAGLPQKFWCTNLLSFLSGVAGVAEYWKVCKVRPPGNAAVVSPLPTRAGSIAYVSNPGISHTNKQQIRGLSREKGGAMNYRAVWGTFGLLDEGQARFMSPRGSNRSSAACPRIRTRHEVQATLAFFKGLYMMELSEMPVEVAK